MPTDADRAYKLRWQKRRRLHEARGTWVSPYVDPERAVAHIEHLRSYGLSHRTLDRLGGFADKTTEQIAGRTMLHRRTEAAILAIRFDLDAIPGHRRVSACGTRRRLQALSRVGYSTRDLSTRLGGTARIFGEYTSADRLAARNARKVRDLYDELAMTAGPSTRAAASAERKGWAPPLAWDDETIDDPAATPNVGDAGPRLSGGRPSEHTAQDVTDVLEWEPMATAARVADRLGATVEAIQQALGPKRANRPELLAQLARNARLAGHGVDETKTARRTA